jgi:hypothetical protein
MEIEELLKKYGADNAEALDKKLAEIERAAADRKKQLEDLERIKSEQGNEIGSLRKKVDEYNLELAKKKEAVPVNNEKSDELYAKECDQIEARLSDAEFDVLDGAFKGLDPEVRKLVERPGEGRLAFIKEVLNTGVTTSQETFRRPVQKRQLTVAEQIQEALGKNKAQNTTPRFQTSGAPASVAKPKEIAIPPSVVRGGSVRDLINYRKQNGG